MTGTDPADVEASGKHALYLSNMPYKLESSRISDFLNHNDLEHVHVEVIKKGFESNQVAAGLAVAFFKDTETRDIALDKLQGKALDGRTIVATLKGFVEADSSGRVMSDQSATVWA